MRYYLEGYPEEYKTGEVKSERFDREREHNEWHDIFDPVLIKTMRQAAANPSHDNARQLLALQRTYFDYTQHEDNIAPADALDYL